jgi:hypothetical protein
MASSTIIYSKGSEANDREQGVQTADQADVFVHGAGVQFLFDAAVSLTF